MVQQLSLFAGETVPLTFIPHLLPNIRGIFSTIYVRLKEKGKSIDYQALYEKAYADEPFVDVLPEGSQPETRMVRGSNMVRIALYRKEPNLLVILVVEDNLVKGSAGQGGAGHEPCHGPSGNRRSRTDCFGSLETTDLKIKAGGPRMRPFVLNATKNFSTVSDSAYKFLRSRQRPECDLSWLL